jgi:hypothetical protein
MVSLPYLGELLRARVASAAPAFTTPGLDSKFRLPRTGNDQALLNAARAFAADAAPLKAEFLKLEMPSDFLERLNQLITDFETSATEKA